MDKSEEMRQEVTESPFTTHSRFRKSVFLCLCHTTFAIVSVVEETVSGPVLYRSIRARLLPIPFAPKHQIVSHLIHKSAAHTSSKSETSGKKRSTEVKIYFGVSVALF